MSNPVLVEVLRGDRVESVHRGAIAVCDADGRSLLAIGNVSRPIFPRSAVKAMQALPLVESGAADALGFTNKELAIACASHKGEAAHIEAARSMLARAGLDENALECGSHWPLDHNSTVTLARSGQSPTALHNNCSGKHAGFLCTCHHIGLAHQGYVTFTHPYQVIIRDVMENLTGEPHDAANSAVDGCSIPTYTIAIRSLARGFARMVTGERLSADRAKAAKRLLAACMAEPFLVAGSDAADTTMMQTAPGRIFVKAGAEGVCCAAVPELGLGIALKCDDGAGRAAEAMVAAVLASLLPSDGPLAARLDELARPVISSRKGEPVGRLQPIMAMIR